MAVSQAASGPNGDICAGNQGSKGWILKIDENGNKVWEKQYPKTGDGYLHTIAKTSNYGYFCTGRSGDSAWVLQIDKNGNLD